MSSFETALVGIQSVSYKKKIRGAKSHHKYVLNRVKDCKKMQQRTEKHPVFKLIIYERSNDEEKNINN